MQFILDKLPKKKYAKTGYVSPHMNSGFLSKYVSSGSEIIVLEL